MKKRFTLMMMVLCFLMSIPLKMMAYDVVTVKSDYNTPVRDKIAISYM